MSHLFSFGNDWDCLSKRYLWQRFRLYRTVAFVFLYFDLRVKSSFSSQHYLVINVIANKIMSVFIQSEWRKLIMINYDVDPKILIPYLPNGTKIDTWNGRCYMSLVGFMFLNTKLKGIVLPFHQKFEEINLRFYIKYYDEIDIIRGTVFIKEIVPKSLVTLVANQLYKEHYETKRMRHYWDINDKNINIEYGFFEDKWQNIKVSANPNIIDIPPFSEANYITEHLWGFSKINETETKKYEVEHPKWQQYLVNDFECTIDFEKTYGSNFKTLNSLKPVSVYLIEGSKIKVKNSILHY